MALGTGALTGTQQVAHAVEGPASSSLDRDPEMETQAGGKGGEHPMGLGHGAGCHFPTGLTSGFT